jgi:4-amino-4-deoxy-L-arabinose transferase-like glycosyltransferase
MREILGKLGQGWVGGVFVLALAMRLGFCLLVDEPLLFVHQLHYFTNGLMIAQQPHPLHFILTTDKWRTWAEHWTIAPLYYVFEGAVFRTLGPHLKPLRIIQCILGAISAVAVAAVGREVVGPKGYWAGIVYAFYAQAVELPSWTLTENLHNVLFAVAFVLVLKAVHRGRGLGWACAAGALLGISALSRSVSSAFIPVAGAWCWWFSDAPDRWKRAGALVASGVLTILPWTLRNIALGEFVPIETAAYENIWTANNFVSPERVQQQLEFIASRSTPAEKREAALRFGLRGIRRHPRAFVHKVNANFWHYFRAEGLRYFLLIQGSIEPWRHAYTVVFEDGIVLGLIPFFLVFAFAGRRSGPWCLVLVWCLYLLFFEVVVFLSEVARHRSVFVPFALAGALEGVRILGSARERRRIPTLLALVLSALWLFGLLSPYAGPAARWIWASWALQPAVAALDLGATDRAERLAESAATLDPTSPRVWFDYGRALAQRDRVPEAVEAYRHGGERAFSENLRGTLALPRLLAAAGLPEEAARARVQANRASWSYDPWLALETAWGELPAPVTDEILLAQGDYGAVRGFLHPRGIDGIPPGLAWLDRESQIGSVPPGPHRWSLHRAWLRLRPEHVAESYDLTLVMGSPYPSPEEHPEVIVTVSGVQEHVHLDPDVRPYTVHVKGGSEILVQLDAPTWNKVGEPAEQGVRVDRMVVKPAKTP